MSECESTDLYVSAFGFRRLDLRFFGDRRQTVHIRNVVNYIQSLLGNVSPVANQLLTMAARQLRPLSFTADV